MRVKETRMSWPNLWKWGTLILGLVTICKCSRQLVGYSLLWGSCVERCRYHPILCIRCQSTRDRSTQCLGHTCLCTHRPQPTRNTPGKCNRRV
uniref:Envelope glycoprotein n=1 Tax=Human immunodeficiency virus type 1 TaxID=11676 RepID=K0H4J9_HV1|nr:envelope glycoprotein [Human immunodeficiency virus 1]